MGVYPGASCFRSARTEMIFYFASLTREEEVRSPSTSGSSLVGKEVLSTAHLRGDKGLCNERKMVRVLWALLIHTSSFDIFYQLLFSFLSFLHNGLKFTELMMKV